MKEGFSDMLKVFGVDMIVGLDRSGKEISLLAIKDGITPEKAQKIFPVVVDEYEWTREEQIRRAQEFRDRIEYIYSPENDVSHPMLSTWRLDDTARIKTTLAMPYGEKVLETGCSSGTVSIEIAKLSQVKEVVGNDLRSDAITTAKDLLAKLVDEGKISKEDSAKIHFEVVAVEDLKYPSEYFDTVCAYEILEHLVIADFHNALVSMSRLLKKDGRFFMSVPNRYPDAFYTESKRMRWPAPDHKNYFSKESLEYLLKKYFKTIIFHSVDGRPTDKGVYLFAEGRDKI